MSTVQSYKGAVPPKMGLGGVLGLVAEVLHDAVVGVPYSETISVVSNLGPYTFSLLRGALPVGMSLNGTTGVISGTPTTVGTASFTIKVTNALLNIGIQDFQISTAAPASPNYGFGA